MIEAIEKLLEYDRAGGPVSGLRERFAKAGQPIISIDTKKKPTRNYTMYPRV